MGIELSWKYYKRANEFFFLKNRKWQKRLEKVRKEKGKGTVESVNLHVNKNTFSFPPDLSKYCLGVKGKIGIIKLSFMVLTGRVENFKMTLL